MFLQRAIDQFTTEQQTDKFGKHHIKSSFEEMTNLIEKSLKETYTLIKAILYGRLVKIIQLKLL